MKVLNYLRRLFRAACGQPSLSDLLSSFTKTRNQLTEFITVSEKQEEAIKASLQQLQIDIDTAKVAKNFLSTLTVK